MIGRVAAALAAYLLCIFHFSNDMISVGHLLGLPGFWALFIPSALIGLSIYKIVDVNEWGLWDAAAFLIIGGITLLSLTNDPRVTLLQLTQKVVGFSVAAILAGLSVRGRKT